MFKSISLLIIFLSFTTIKTSLKFKIPSYKEKCFEEDLYLEGTLLIQYHLSGYENDFKPSEVSKFFKSIKIYIKDEKENIIFNTELKARKDKFAVYMKKEGKYLICSKYDRAKGGKDLSDSVLMGIKIRDDYKLGRFENSIQKEDIKDFWDKIRNVKKEMIPSIEAAKKEIEKEDKVAKSIISSLNVYYFVSLIQLVVIILVTCYLLYNFKTYFKSKSII